MRLSVCALFAYVSIRLATWIARIATALEAVGLKLAYLPIENDKTAHGSNVQYKSDNLATCHTQEIMYTLKCLKIKSSYSL